MKTLGQFLEEAQSLGGALKNPLMKPEPGSKLDSKIKAHNRSIKFGNPSGPHTMSEPPAGHHFDKKGFIRLGESGESVESLEEAKATYCGRCGTTHVPPSKGGTCPALKEAHTYKNNKEKRVSVTDTTIPTRVDTSADQNTSMYEESEYLDEMEKDLRQGQRWDYQRQGQRGPDKTAKPITTKEFAKDALKSLEDAGTRNEMRSEKILHKGNHVATIRSFRGRSGGWLSSAHTPDGKDASKKYGINMMDTKKQILSKIKTYHKENDQ